MTTPSNPTTTATLNKQLMLIALDELSRGNPGPFRDRLADNIRWTVSGTTRWSRTYTGKQALLTELFGSVARLLTAPVAITPVRVVADDEHVVLELHGMATNRQGKPYNNRYCAMCRIVDGKLTEVTEYLDTALVDAAL